MSGGPAKPKSETGSGKKFKPPPNLKPGQTSITRRPPSGRSGARKPLEQLDTASWRADLRPDPFVKSDLVYELNESTLSQFLGEKDVAMVLFYDPCDSLSRWCKPRFAKAAEITKRDNHAYAAVNCVDGIELCIRQQVDILPTYGLYSRGRMVGTVTEISDFTSENIKNFVEKTPVFEDTFSTNAPCQQGGT